MKLIIQRTQNATVTVAGERVGHIEQGFLILVGVTHTDTEKEVRFLAKKVAGLRVFNDVDGKMNLSIKQIDGQVLSVSQFTLYADARHGNRPSFVQAAQPQMALKLYELFNDVLCREHDIPVSTGRFGEHMQVAFTNDGPVTIVLDTDELMKK